MKRGSYENSTALIHIPKLQNLCIIKLHFIAIRVFIQQFICLLSSFLCFPLLMSSVMHFEKNACLQPLVWLIIHNIEKASNSKCN